MKINICLAIYYFFTAFSINAQNPDWIILNNKDSLELWVS